jgi:hypothetical protein
LIIVLLVGGRIFGKYLMINVNLIL